MIEAFKCDMCGEFHEYEPAAIIERGDGFRFIGGGADPRHLCLECWKKVRAFIKDGE